MEKSSAPSRRLAERSCQDAAAGAAAVPPASAPASDPQADSDSVGCAASRFASSVLGWPGRPQSGAARQPRAASPSCEASLRFLAACRLLCTVTAASTRAAATAVPSTAAKAALVVDWPEQRGMPAGTEPHLSTPACGGCGGGGAAVCCQPCPPAAGGAALAAPCRCGGGGETLSSLQPSISRAHRTPKPAADGGSQSPALPG